MPGRFSLGAVLAGLAGLPLLAALMLAESQPSQGHTVSGEPAEPRPLPLSTAGSLFPSLLAMRNTGPRHDEGEVEEKGIILDLGGGVKLELVRIPAGQFLMGSPKTEEGYDQNEGPQHLVEITRPFYLGRYEVTQEQYQKVMGENPSCFSPQGGGKNEVQGRNTARFPVDSVTWHGAVLFCRKLSQMDQQRRTFRLPTEAEWEYACRAGTSTPFSFGGQLNGTQANCAGDGPYGTREKGPNLKRTAKVGSYPANAWGLYDMHGNIEEWCQDWFSVNYYASSPQLDPQGPRKGTARLLRGGCWQLAATYSRAANRDLVGPEASNPIIGFRVAYRPD